MRRKINGFHATSVLFCVYTIGLLALISCGTPGSGGGDNGGGDANADTNPSSNSDDDPVACCMADDSCVVMALVDCAFTNGAVLVDGVSSCNNDPCNRGACCNNGACLVTTEAECQNNYQGDATSCSSSPCRVGACCVEEELGTCMDVDEDDCLTNLEGTWKGIDTACEPTKPCGGATDQGACCTTDGSCSITDAATCVFSDRFYAGDGIECENALCSTGACCGQDGSCTETGRFGCFDDFQGLGTRCVNDSCADRGGACCMADGTCADLIDESDCESFGAGSTFQGLGTSCLGTICRVTEGGCCDQSGGCTIVANTEACDALTGLSGISSTFRGAGSPCIWPNGDELCGGPLRGACCFSFGRCEGATVERCALLEDGVFIGMLISCSDFERLPATCTTR